VADEPEEFGNFTYIDISIIKFGLGELWGRASTGGWRSEVAVFLDSVSEQILALESGATFSFRLGRKPLPGLFVMYKGDEARNFGEDKPFISKAPFQRGNPVRSLAPAQEPSQWKILNDLRKLKNAKDNFLKNFEINGQIDDFNKQ
jgi:hypothetical protein